MKIIINGKQHTTHKRQLAYHDVIDMSHGVKSPRDILYSITFRNARYANLTGILGPHDRIAIKSGTIFDVAVTN